VKKRKKSGKGEHDAEVDKRDNRMHKEKGEIKKKPKKQKKSIRKIPKSSSYERIGEEQEVGTKQTLVNIN